MELILILWNATKKLIKIIVRAIHFYSLFPLFKVKCREV